MNKKSENQDVLAKRIVEASEDLHKAVIESVYNNISNLITYETQCTHREVLEIIYQLITQDLIKYHINDFYEVKCLERI